MSMVKKSVTVTDEQAAWIARQIRAGLYGSDSEVIRDALRDKQLRLAELEAIRARLIEAEAGGFTGEDPRAVRDRVRAGLKTDGAL